jgi:hypothetical protein
MYRTALLLMICLAGCDKSSNEPAAETPRTPPGEAEPPGVAPTPARPPAPAEAPIVAPAGSADVTPGPAYLGLDGVGVVRVADGKVTPVLANRYKIQDIVVGARGVVYVAAIGGVFEIDGAKTTRLDTDRFAAGLAHLALGPDGVLWGLAHDGVHRWDGKEWTHEPKSTFDDALLVDITVDRQGRVWLAASELLWRLDGDSWTRIDGSFTGDRRPFFKTLALGPDGAVYVSGLSGVFVFRDGVWTDTSLGEMARSYDELVIGPGGHIAGSGGVGDLVLATPGAAPRRMRLDRPAAGKPKISARRGDVLAVDAAGRAWLTTDNGLLILDATGEVVAHWLPGTIPGITAAVTAAAVVGGGPALPEAREAARGSIVGKVLRGGKPVAGAAVELCDRPLSMFQKTPCGHATFARSTTTRQDGTFRLDDVPIGTYGFAVRPQGTWLILIGGECCAAMTEGEVYDVGAITVK